MMERATGIEPASSAWRAEVIAIIRCPHMVPTTGIELVTYWLQVSCSTYWAKSALVPRGRNITDEQEFPSEPFSIIRQNVQRAITDHIKLYKFTYLFRFLLIILHRIKIWQAISKQFHFTSNYQNRYFHICSSIRMTHPQVLSETIPTRKRIIATL